MDTSLPEQRNVAAYDLAVVILPADSKDLAGLTELVPEVERAAPNLDPAEVYRVYPPSP